MAAIAGKSTKVYAKATAPGSTTWGGSDEIAGFKSCKLDNGIDILDTTTFISTTSVKSKLATLSDSTFTLSGLFESADTPQLAASNVGADCWVGFNPGGAAGANGFSVQGIVKSVNWGSEVAGMVEISVTIEGNGAVSKTYTFP